MKTKSLLVLLLAGIWGVGSWWWYTCKVKGFCGAETNSTQVAAGAVGAAALSSSGTVIDNNGDNGGKNSLDQAGMPSSSGMTDADKAAAEQQAKADADKDAAEQQAKADADKAAAEQQAKADADKADAEQQAKADADKAAAEQQAKADADKAAVEQQAKADADKADAEQQAKADADKAAAEQQAKADADKAAAEQQAKADADKVTIETSSNTGNDGIGPATLHFPTGSSNPELADDTKAYFEKAAKFLQDNSGAKISIVGHTDNKGDAAKNKILGLKRADILRDMLVKLGAPKDRVNTSSEGSNKPIADNNTEAGRQKNRRVEITPTK
ncbi:OmpA family protein [Candidatus Thiothrix sp. Deng01]|uniref:OmpA family protein n=1 Tax=Candidatus Thiothrix phosphatis TaxID=3112415 RepID=A0ABU6CYH0_9GAMM|nr:OmpA family protein [Candidatus Thiothrix sp. Deng01]MEB4591885.1 OmpA family protein [Candidatus Thiothrix sp. Deng01]